MPISAGTLRHRIRIESRTDVQDPDTGATNPVWTTQFDDLPASVEPLSAREFVAAQAVNSEVSARITIRYQPGITPRHRIVFGDRVFNIEGVLSDKDSGIEYLTLPVSEGVNDGN